MQFISESIIDQVIAEWDDRLETEGIEPLLGELGDNQPYVLAYLTSETHNILMEAEREYLLFMGIVLWKSIRKAHPDTEMPVAPDFLEEAEEEAWTLLQESKERAFHRRITPFFEDYSQEDLLAFVEDTLAADDDSPITQTGREPLFVAAKAVLDALLRAGST